MRYCYACGSALSSEHAQYCDNCGKSQTPPASISSTTTPIDTDSAPAFSFQEFTPAKEAATALSREHYQGKEVSHYAMPAVHMPEVPNAQSASEQFASGIHNSAVEANAITANEPTVAVPSSAEYAPLAPVYQPQSGVFPPQTPVEVPSSSDHAPLAPVYQPQSGVYPPQAPMPQPGAPYDPAAMPSVSSPQNIYPPIPGQAPYSGPQGAPSAFPPQGSTPYGPYYPPVPAPAPRKRSWFSSTPAKILIAAILLVLLIGGSATSYYIYLITRPKPVISIDSVYNVNALPTGSTNVGLTFKGSDFTKSSPITILMDGYPLPGQPQIISDKDGKAEAVLTVKEEWVTGKHTLTAKDGDGYTTAKGVAINIVKQGEAGTPGPGGAPADNESFTISGQTNKNTDLNITVTGQPDPQGGLACFEGADGHVFTDTGKLDDGTPYTTKYATTCSGTYKSGKLEVTETMKQEETTFVTQGVTFTCKTKTPYESLKVEGTYGPNQRFSGTYTFPATTATCTPYDISLTTQAESGTWDGGPSF
ncbi:hypothetical protein KSC_052510 [Ktedonobacter sp. SOSP1-52]|uniref:hypothetical protein n=1 Tax=Ktedonobacter sp. SOSP1-52 TaxID=2778366 RepID=UPI0019159302|nr:hypothetical protein [Ktedonobacter sp. SOSP1-52]GHO66359.1 hypothetical protein KSC_052510 [Ktedonobacter sp. SOSP1-52]